MKFAPSYTVADALLFLTRFGQVSYVSRLCLPDVTSQTRQGNGSSLFHMVGVQFFCTFGKMFFFSFLFCDWVNFLMIPAFWHLDFSYRAVVGLSFHPFLLHTWI